MKVFSNENGEEVVEIRKDDIVAIIDSNSDVIKVNQIDPFDKSGFKYSSITFNKEEIIALAEHLKSK